MTVKQQKIGLLSSSTEESALAVSLPQLYQITSNALLRLAACMHYQPSISPDRLHFQVDQSYFPPPDFFPLQSVKKLEAGSGSHFLFFTPIPVQVAYLQANSNPWSQSAECEVGLRKCSDQRFYGVTSTRWECFSICVFCVVRVAVEQKDSY